MSLVFNEAALHRLLEDEAGPVGLELTRISENVTRIYNANVCDYLPEFCEQGGEVAFQIVTDDRGLQSTIAIAPGHGSDRFAENVAKKILKEPNKALDALEQGLHQ